MDSAMNRNVALVVTILTVAAGFTIVKTPPSQPGAVARDETTARSAPAPKSTAAAQTAADESLAAAINQILEKTDVKHGRWGVFVMSLKDQRIIYSRDGDRLFVPASNMKIYTTAAAVDLLGPDYRWRTSVYSHSRPDKDGSIAGDLILYGRGAPDLVSKSRHGEPSLATIADTLYAAGLRRVGGNIVGDESYLRGEMFGRGWQWNDLQWYYGAQPSALSIDENTVELTISPGANAGETPKVVVTPGDKYTHLTNNAATTGPNVVTSIGIMRDLSTNRIRVWGNFPARGHAFSAFLSVHSPSLWAATAFRQALLARGIQVEGEAAARDFRAAEKDRFDPAQAIELASVQSAPLSEIIRKTNKESNNLYAELLLRTLGKEHGPAAPDPVAQKTSTRGDDEAGAAVIKWWLARKGIAAHGLSMHDGSGLSRLDLVTPELTSRLLAAMAQANAATVFHDSLPNAGRDGTLNGRLKRFENRIFAKTGSLTYVHALSGYARTGAGEQVVFSIVCNDATADRAALHTIDEIAAAIADSSAAPTKP